jgi:cytosine/adenosine deaminase-related metal-dependent hydrolase
MRYHARFVLPITAPPIENGCVCVERGRITWVGPRAETPNDSSVDVDLGDAVLLPGLVNVHTHLELTVMRGFLEDLAFRPWIVKLTRARRDVLSLDDLRDSARVGIAEGLRAGITTYADTTDTAQSFEAMRDAGVRGIAYHEVFGPDPARAPAALAELRENVERWRERETDLIRIGISPHAPYSVSDALFELTARYAGEASLPIAVHIAESEDELRFVRDGIGPFADDHRARGIAVAPRGRSPVAMLEKNGVLDARPLLIHCVRVDAGDIARIRTHDCAVAHCPVSNAKLGHGAAPLQDMLDAGVRLGIGTDSVASNNRMELLGEARIASLMQRARLGSSDAFPATRLLELATIGGATALGLESAIGSLEAGKQADLAAFSLDGLGSTPAFDPATALVFGGPVVASIVTVGGRVLVRDGELVDPPTDATLRVRGAARRLAAWAS